jgi:uncharacterized membrane-anchored protein YhcB (DUF1043 family)
MEIERQRETIDELLNVRRTLITQRDLLVKHCEKNGVWCKEIAHTNRLAYQGLEDRVKELEEENAEVHERLRNYIEADEIMEQCRKNMKYVEEAHEKLDKDND